MASEFKQVYANQAQSDAFFLFLENVFHLFPEDKFQQLIKDATKQFDTDEAIYKHIVATLPSIKPFLAEITYALPALWKQKKEMSKQTLAIIGDKKNCDGYVEIGSTGRYISELKKHIQVNEPIYLVHDVPASYSPADIFERGSLFKLGNFVPLNAYQPISGIADKSVDIVTCYIGLHHTPDAVLGPFVASIGRILRKGGFFILRDHDVQTPEMHTFVSLVHTVFNAGTDITWEVEHQDFKKFRPVAEWSNFITNLGFEDTGKQLLQDKDPSLNTLMGFVKK